MAEAVAWVDRGAAADALRRALRPEGVHVARARDAAALRRALAESLVDVAVVEPDALRLPFLAALAHDFPAVPFVAWAPFRPDDGALLLALDRVPMAIVVEGVDDPVLGWLVVRASASSRRARALAEAPRLLRLTEPLQLEAWARLVGAGGTPPSVTALAQELGMSREHLSRQFGAGGAPNLKRVIDFLRLLRAAELLACPALGPTHVARLLGFSSSDHLHRTSRRLTGADAHSLAALGASGALAAFARVGLRSRTHVLED